MVQVLPGVESFGAQFGRAIGQGAGEGFTSAMEKKQKMAELLEENKEIYKATGINLSGISNPEARKAYFSSELQARNQEKLQSLKGQQKENEKAADEAYLEKLIGGGSVQNEQPSLGQQDEGFNPLNISDEAIVKASARKPAIGSALQKTKDVALREKSKAEELELKKKRSSPEFRREQQIEGTQATADVKYNQQLQEASKQHELKEQSLNRLEKLNEKGVTGKPYEKLLEKSGLVALTSDGRREFAADVKNLITDIRSILGAQFTGFEFQTILNAYPSADFSKEANRSIIKNLKEFQEIKKKEVEYANQIKKENGGKLPFDFQSLVNEKVRDYAASRVSNIKNNTQKIMNEEYGIKPGFVLMFDEQGDPLNVPEDRIEEALEKGAIMP